MGAFGDVEWRRAPRGGFLPSAARGGPAAPRAADRRWWRDSFSRAQSARPTRGTGPGAKRRCTPP